MATIDSDELDERVDFLKKINERSKDGNKTKRRRKVKTITWKIILWVIATILVALSFTTFLIVKSTTNYGDNGTNTSKYFPDEKQPKKVEK